LASTRRAARRVLANSDVAVGTAVLAPGESPDGAVWQIPGRGTGRHRLARLLDPPRDAAGSRSLARSGRPTNP